MNARSEKMAAAEPALAGLAQGAGVSDEAKALLLPDDTPPAYVARLVAEGFPGDAVRVVSALLPAREGVWWGWTCSRKAVGDTATEAVIVAFAAIERWLRDPTDANRRAAMDAGEAADFGTPAGCVALATFFSGGSIAPANVDPVPPPPFVSGKALAAAILISAVLTEPEKGPEKLNEYLEQGIHVARRVGIWPA